MRASRVACRPRRGGQLCDAECEEEGERGERRECEERVLGEGEWRF